MRTVSYRDVMTHLKNPFSVDTIFGKEKNDRTIKDLGVPQIVAGAHNKTKNETERSLLNQSL